MSNEYFGTWHGIEMSPAVENWMHVRGYSAGAISKKAADAESIVGPELLMVLEEAAANQDEIMRRSALGLDYADLVVKDAHGPGSTGAPHVDPASLLLANDDFQQALSLIEPLFENAISNIIQSQLSPSVVIEEASHIAHAAQPLKQNAISVLAEASNLAKARLQANAGVNAQETERASVMLIEYLTKTHFVQVSIGAREDGAEAMSEAQRRMMALVEPSISAVPEVTADHLAGMVSSVVNEIIDGPESNEPMEAKSMSIPQAEYAHAKSDHNVTPRLRDVVRKSVYTPEVMAQLGQTPAPAPAAPAQPLVRAGQGRVISAEALAEIVKRAISPIVADLETLKTRNALATRTATRRALTVAPVVSRAAAAAAVGGGSPMVIRTVETSIHGGLPSQRRVFSPAEIARQSTGLGLTERSNAPNRPVAFPSKYTTSTFATQAARDHFDSGFENQPKGVVSPHRLSVGVPLV